MADIRIKDLTTTASSTASDDFIAVDGATNGTRKLNAYSPSFGGNATVAGAMNVGGVITTDAEYLQGSNVNFNIRSTATNGNVYLKSNGGTLYLNNTAGNGDIRLGNTGNVVTVVGTTASTSTSTGALVVSGGLGVGGSLNAGAVFAANSITGGDTGFGTSIIQFKDGSGSTKINFKGNGEVTMSATTASTSTLTGALVVNGGVGVAGTIYAGGTIRVVGSSHTLRFRRDDAIIDFSNTAENAYVAGTISGNTLELKGNNGTGLTIGTTGNATFAGTLTVSAGSLVVDHVGSSSPTLSLSANGSVQSRFFANGSNTFLESYTNTPLILRTNQTTALTITSGQQVQVNATTASTTTSSGALVVSGGVGVAGNIYAGGNTFSLSKSGDNPAIKSTDGTIITKIQSVSVGDTAGYIGTESLNTLKIVTNNTAALTITTAQKAEFASTIKTAAPSGGTAAEWKLGTVASVSPTSPNRTIEVDIGGTIYYIHAKTTNN